MNRDGKRLLRRLYRKPALLVVVIFIVLTGVATATFLRGRYLTSLDAGHRRAGDLALLLEEQTLRNFQAVDLVLQGIADNVRPDLPEHDPAFRDMLKRRLQSLPHVSALFVIGRDGLITHDTNFPSTPRVSLADRDYFKAHQANPSLGLHIGPPQESRSVARWFVFVSRRISSPSDDFNGIAVAAVEPSFYATFYKDLNLGPHDAVTLLHADGTVIAQAPEDYGLVGRNLHELTLFQDYLPKQPRGTFVAASEDFGKQDRIISYRALPELPLVISVALSKAGVLANWRGTTIAAAIGFVLLTALAALAVFLIVLHGRDRRQAEAEIKASEERYRALVRAGVSVVWRADPDGRILAAEGNKDVIGPPIGEDKLQGWIERIHPEDQPRVVALWQHLQSAQQAGDAEYRIQGPDGVYRWAVGKMVPLKDQDGSIREWVGTITDISERHRLEAQLRQSQKMEAVGQLTGGIAHDFNNLLTVILGNAEVLEDDPSDPILTKRLSGMIVQAAEKGMHLTQHLLAFGRRQTLKPERLNLNEVALNMEPILRSMITESIEIVTEFGKADSDALTDRTLLESAILNLVVNAKDAMPRGGILTIRTGVRTATLKDGNIPAGQPVAFISVTDTGTGMSPEVLERAMEPFYTTKEVGKGTGLGLSMVFGFTQQAGGHLDIESTVGKGTTVVILLPAIDRQVLQVSGKDEAWSTRRGNERLLVVEDDPQVRSFLCAQLVSLGYNVEAVSVGVDALNILEKDRNFDCLFTDVVLPKGMSGVEIARMARSIKPDLRVLLTSGYPEEAFEHHGRPDADMPLLRKPYKRKELAEVLRRVLDAGT